MIEQKYTWSSFDHCVYYRELWNETFIYFLLYIDDMLITSKSKMEIEKLKTQMSNELEMKDLGEAKKTRGMGIQRDKVQCKVCLSQKQYLKKILQGFGIDEKTKYVSTLLPLTSSLVLLYLLAQMMSVYTLLRFLIRVLLVV